MKLPPNTDRLIRNAARCLNCKTIIESKHRHDFVVCPCFKDEVGNTGIFIDGGHDYIRRGGCLANFDPLFDIERSEPEE